MLTAKQIEQYAKVCKKTGITHLKLGDVEITIDLSQALQSKKQEQAPEIKEEQTFTDEETLLWSSPNI